MGFEAKEIPGCFKNGRNYVIVKMEVFEYRRIFFNLKINLGKEIVLLST
jgi:hypothetical protein